ncbi:MAG: glycoside hydrolase family 97 protein, partial [Sphingomonadales bacterium]|nr:glycoside hydrolase family 97 protein [Sphingomonadales bacterium]
MFVSLLALVAAQPALAEVVASADSPDKSITVAVSIDNDGRASYAVTRKGRPVIANSALGFLFTDAPKLDRYFGLVDAKTTRNDTTWTQPFGEWQTIRDNHTQLTVRLKEKVRDQREMLVTFRIFNDGVGFRYTLPTQPNLRQVNIADELTE